MSLRLTHAYYECLRLYTKGKHRKKSHALADLDRACWRVHADGKSPEHIESTIRQLNHNAFTMSYCLKPELRLKVVKWCRESEECLRIFASHFLIAPRYAREEAQYADCLYERCTPIATRPTFLYGSPYDKLRNDQPPCLVHKWAKPHTNAHNFSTLAKPCHASQHTCHLLAT